ncbi:MAG TPA: metal-sulfur cluster assembly factor [Symbiobacteriaceae bacterium]|jgi:metal-sulfur cluster biosynthetic enzyme
MDKVELARTLLKNVVDPELGLDIVNLGLIYELVVEDNKAYIEITFTTMGCPVAGHITNQIYEVLEPLAFADIKVDITFDPPWSPMMMSPEAKQRMGWRG